MTTRRLNSEIRQKVPLHEGFLRLYKYVFEVERHDGGTDLLKREVMERGDAVAVLGYDPKRDEVVLGNEFRPGVKIAGEYPYRDNLVAGGIDGEETAMAAAVREMREEAGLELREPVVIHSGAFVSSVAHPNESRSSSVSWTPAKPVASMATARSRRTS